MPIDNSLQLPLISRLVISVLHQITKDSTANIAIVNRPAVLAGVLHLLHKSVIRVDIRADLSKQTLVASLRR